MIDPVTLRELMEARFNAHADLHKQHDGAHDREHKATEEAISKAETSTATALTRAEEVVTARFAAQNEWRQAMNDRERNFLTKAEYQAAHDPLLKRLDSLEDAELARATRETERASAQVRTMALIGLVATVVSVMLSVLIRLGIG